MIQLIDRMTGQEESYRATLTKVELRARSGFSCQVEHEAGKSAATLALSCNHQGSQKVGERSCEGADAPIIKQWDRFDRMGANVLSVVLACVPEGTPAPAAH